MKRKQPESDLGKRFAARRIQQGLSQVEVSRRLGIDPSYLSRIETGKVHPTVRTAMRIAAALRTPLEDILGPSPAELRNEGCPVSPSGRCLLDLIDAKEDSRKRNGLQKFSPRQLRLLRNFATVLQRGTPELLKAFQVLIGGLLQGVRKKRK